MTAIAMDTLFDAAPFTVPAAVVPAGEQLSADRRRTLRQAAAIARGVHPLALPGAGVRVHPDADPARTASKDNAADRPMRCGTCVFRRHSTGGGKSWPKCSFDGWARASHGAGTDVRSWWPACTDYQAVAA